MERLETSADCDGNGVIIEHGRRLGYRAGIWDLKSETSICSARIY